MTAIAGGSPNVFPTPASATPPVASASSTPNSGSASATDRATINQTYDQFLLLLTTQLKNQDPMSPMDSAQFTDQLVSFSQVEQQIKTNDNLTKLMTLTNNSQTTLGLSYIGLTVGMQDSQFAFDPAKESSININYNMPAGAATGIISVLDKNNNVIYTQPADTNVGAHVFNWTGNDLNGLPVSTGEYQVRIGAADSKQNNLTVPTIVPAHVTGIQTADDGSINLVVDGTRQVPMSSIRQASL